RMYEQDGALTIIDYKTGADSEQTREQWIAQLRRYWKLVEQEGSSQVASTLILQAGQSQILDLSTETAETLDNYQIDGKKSISTKSGKEMRGFLEGIDTEVERD